MHIITTVNYMHIQYLLIKLMLLQFPSDHVQSLFEPYLTTPIQDLCFVVIAPNLVLQVLKKDTFIRYG